MFVSEDQSEALVAYFRVLAEANAPLSHLRLKGLDPNQDYEIEGLGVYGGDELMYAGVAVPHRLGDFISMMWRLKAVQR